MLYDRKYYELYYNGVATEVLEPLEWDEDEKSFERNETYHGISIKLAAGLTFVKEAKELLEYALEDGGPNADVRIRRYDRNEQTDIWEINYEGWVDYNTYDISEDGFNVALNADPLTVLFKSKLSSRVEVERLTSLSEVGLDPLTLNDLYIEGREILITNKLAQTEDERPGINCYDGKNYICAIPIAETGDVNDGIIDVKDQFDVQSRQYNGTGQANESFLDWNDHGQVMTYRVNVALKTSFFWYQLDGATEFQFKIRIAIHGNYETQTFVREIVLWEPDSDSLDDFPRTLDLTYPEIELEMQEGESASLQWYGYAPSGRVQMMTLYPLSCGGGLGDYGNPYDINKCKYVAEDGTWQSAFFECSVTVQEDSVRSPSTVKCVKINDYAKRLTDIILESDYKSDLLSNSDVSDLVLTHGMWLRGQEAGENNFKPLSTTFKDFLDSLDFHIPIGVDLTNNTMMIEDREYFYQNNVAVDLGEVSELHIAPSTNDYYTTISIGYNQVIGYDEDLGLDDYNRRTDYNTILNKTDNTLDLNAKYRTDTYGLESVRREDPNVGLGTKNEDDDTKFDDHIWFVDANEVAGQTALDVSHWSKRFAKAPEAVYSPETAFNLWFSPINVLLRYGSWLKGGLLKYLDSQISFNYSEGNSDLVTQLIDGIEYTQRTGVPVKDFERSQHNGKLATFRAKVTWEQLNGSVNGVPNRYNLFQFTRLGVRYRGHIMTVKTQAGIGDFSMKLATSTTASSTYVPPTESLEIPTGITLEQI